MGGWEDERIEELEDGRRGEKWGKGQKINDQKT